MRLPRDVAAEGCEVVLASDLEYDSCDEEQSKEQDLQASDGSGKDERASVIGADHGGGGDTELSYCSIGTGQSSRNVVKSHLFVLV